FSALGDLGTLAELGLEIGFPLDAIRGDSRIEAERPPANLEFHIGALVQRPIQAALADKAPGTNGIGDDVDEHFPKIGYSDEMAKALCRSLTKSGDLSHELRPGRPDGPCDWRHKWAWTALREGAGSSRR